MTYAPKTFVLDTNAESKQILADILAETTYFMNRLSPSSKVTLTPTPGADVIHITPDQRHTGASGYHVSVNGIPTAYCLPEVSIYGHYNSGILPARVVAGIHIPAEKIHEPLMTPGLITTVCHEMAEMLADGNIATYTRPDSKGHKWLLEPCDWVFQEYFQVLVGKNMCIFPNVALDAFTDVTNKIGPYDLCGKVLGPFQRSSKGYAYYLDPITGKLMPVTY